MERDLAGRGTELGEAMSIIQYALVMGTGAVVALRMFEELLRLWVIRRVRSN